MCEAPHEIRDFFLRDFLVFFHAIFWGEGGELGNVRGRSRARRRLAEHRGAKEWHSRGGRGSAVIVRLALAMLSVVIVIVIIAMMIKALHHDRAKTSEARPKR